MGPVQKWERAPVRVDPGVPWRFDSSPNVVQFRLVLAEVDERTDAGDGGETLGPLVAARRSELGLNQSALAERMDVSRATISRIENGRPQSTETLMRLATALRPEEGAELERSLEAELLFRGAITGSLAASLPPAHNRLSMSRLSMPHLPIHRPSMPRLSIPRPSMPQVSIHRPSMPRLSIPRPSMPRVSIPRVSIPRPSIPRVSIPRPSISRLSIPSVSMPSMRRLPGDLRLPFGALAVSALVAVMAVVAIASSGDGDADGAEVTLKSEGSLPSLSGDRHTRAGEGDQEKNAGGIGGGSDGPVSRREEPNSGESGAPEPVNSPTRSSRGFEDVVVNAPGAKPPPAQSVAPPATGSEQPKESPPQFLGLVQVPEVQAPEGQAPEL